MPIVLDCGTGARPLGVHLVMQPGREATLLFSHLHLDHVFGFPFFAPIYTPGFRLQVHVPAFTDEQARDKLGRYLDGVFHPTRLRDLPAEVVFVAARSGRELTVPGWNVRTLNLNHPGGSLGYRLEAGGRSIAYLTDTAPFARPGEGVAAGAPAVPAEARVIDFVRGCDLVLFDTMYELPEYLEKMTWGHAYPEYAVAFCAAAGVPDLVLFHHLPDATDDELDARAARWRDHQGPRVRLAREGETVVVGEATMNVEG